MTDDEHWSDRDQHVAGFNDKANQLPESDLPDADPQPDLNEKPPIFGLHDGPKPPGSVEREVKAQVREEEAIRKAKEAEEAAFVKIEKSSYNDINNDNDVSDHEIDGRRDEGL